MNFNKINYSKLNPKQKEIFNFQKIAGLLADYGFNCIKLADDWQGADFIAYHKDGNETLLVQLKARLTIEKKYMKKDLYITFPIKNDKWCLILHDELVKKIETHSNWLNTPSWLDTGKYHSANPNKNILDSLAEYIIE